MASITIVIKGTSGGAVAQATWTCNYSVSNSNTETTITTSDISVYNGSVSGGTETEQMEAQRAYVNIVNRGISLKFDGQTVFNGWVWPQYGPEGSAACVYSKSTARTTSTRNASLQFYATGATSFSSSTNISVPVLPNHKIIYSANGGSGAPSEVTKYYGKNITLSTVRPVRLGYIFMGWATSSTGSVVYQPGATYSENPTTNVTLYAVWHQNPSLTSTITSSEPYYHTKSLYSVSTSNIILYDSATISSIALTVGTQTTSRTSAGELSINPLSNFGSFIPELVITDSLGASTSYALDELEIKQYVAPIVNPEVYRTSNIGSVEDEGIYCVLKAQLSFTDEIANLIKPTITINNVSEGQESFSVVWYYNWDSTSGVSNTVDWNEPPTTSPCVLYGLLTKFSTQGEPEGFSIYRTYDIVIKAKDSTGGESVGTIQRLAPAFYTIDIYAGGRGIAFGQAASPEGFYCNMEAHFPDKEGFMKTLVDFFYPVGSYYETSDTTFNPNLTWGGTWVKESEGLVHVSAGVNYAVSGANLLGGQGQLDGGNKDAIVPLHDHPFTNPEYQAKDGAVGDKAAFNTGAMNSNAKHSHGGWGENAAANWTLFNGADIGFNRWSGVGETNTDHTHQVPAHGHTFTQPTISLKSGKGGVVNSVGESVIDANMPPHINVVKWHRIPDPE